MKHGASAYRNSYCRCQVCRDDTAARTRRERAARKEWLAADPSLAPHGNVYTYNNWGCRCGLCTDASKADLKARRARRMANDG
jgi:hypothetical protein